MNMIQTAVRTFRLCVVIVAGGAVAGTASPAETSVARESAARQCGGEPCQAVVRGFAAFIDRDLHSLGGNGRSCADCHMLSDSLQLSPASANRRFEQLQRRRAWNPRADDPLFRAIDADDFRINGAAATDFSNLRENGLVRIEFMLPPNVKLIDPATNQPSTETSVDVWRMVPSVHNVKLTGPDTVNPWPRGPNPSGGYQLDARFGDLPDQALGALLAHAGITAPPRQQMLDDLASFQRVLFSNQRVRDLSEAVSANTSPLPDADPPLNALEQKGKVVFTRACAHCHGGPGGSTPLPTIARYHSVATQCPRPVDVATPARFKFLPCPARLARNARTYEITLPNGLSIRRTSSDPGRALLTGFAGVGPAPADDWNKMDMPSLIGIRNTAPYFHNNSADTLEDVVDHYIEFFKLVPTTVPPGVVPPISSTDGVHFDRAPSLEERESLLAYLRKL